METKNFMTPLRISLCFILLFLTTTSAQAPVYSYNSCMNSTSISPTYKTNVKSLLSWITNDSSISKGFNYTTISSNNGGDNDGYGDAVYGLYSCRYDITGYFCQFCLTTAVNEISRLCPDSVTAILWYDVCILRYSNQSFHGKVSLSPTWNVTGPRKIKNSTETKKIEDAMEGLITKATIETKQFWAVEEFDWGDNETLYGWVQCDRDLPSDECRKCLNAMLEIFPQCCGTKVQWAVFAPTCGMRMDDEKFYQKSDDNGTSTSRKLIISFSVLGSVALLCFSVYCFLYRKRVRKDEMMLDEETLNGDLPTIPLITILNSTNNFSKASKLGEGGFGPVYKGILPDGRQIAVKRLSQFSGQGSEEFRNEVMFIAKLQHRNLVRLLACCLQEKEKILVYEYMSNASLDSHLFDDEKKKQLDWKLRLRIIHGIARGILYLHEDSRLRVIHRDLKPSNVLLDDEMNAKISDFGLARAFEIGQNQANTKRAWNIWCAGKCLELMDLALVKSFIASEVEKCIHIALLCVQQDEADRPTISTVVLMLGSDTIPLPKPNHPAFSVGRMTLNEASTSGSSKNLSINDVTVSTMLPRIVHCLVFCTVTDNGGTSKSRKLILSFSAPGLVGILPDGRTIAVKRLSKASGHGLEEFKNEVMFIAKLQHRSLACCLEENEKILLYEYMPNGSLDTNLFGTNKIRLISFSRYMAPEYAMQGLFLVKSVFSALEFLFWKSLVGERIAWNMWCAGKCFELMDPLEKSFMANEVVKSLLIGLLCVQQDAIVRPTISTVVLMLGSDTVSLPKPNHPAFSVGTMNSNNEESSFRSSKNISINNVTISTILPRE
ncbi:Cysteine-rich receptor-like protein kinase 10 [Glycine max]|nr:Cysteine-rich receptor-like protein kinase 10 [Glycine max]